MKLIEKARQVIVYTDVVDVLGEVTEMALQGVSCRPDFLSLIVGHLTENGVMDAGALFESPFTDVAPRGPTSLFIPDEVGRLVGVLEHVRSTAANEGVVA